MKNSYGSSVCIKKIFLGFIFVSQYMFTNAILKKARPVLLISFDGLRDLSFDEFIQENPNSNFKTFMDAGVRAEWMRPSFPSQTFPNHFTMVTGN